MARFRRSWRSQVAAAIGAMAIAGFVIFGSFETQAPLGTGQTVVTAQASQSLAASTAVAGAPTQGAWQGADALSRPSAAQVAAAEAQMEMAAAGMAARMTARAVPAGTPPAAELASNPSVIGPQADNTFQVFRNVVLNPAAGGLNSSSVGEPAVAQNGRLVFETWNWGAARSANGGVAWTFMNPYGDMPDFCCDQDAIYDKGRNRMFWLRQGVNNAVGCGAGCAENRDFISVSGDGMATYCTYDLRPSGHGQANNWFDYPRMALSNNYLYVGTNVFNDAGGYVTHLLLRLPLTPMANCAGFSYSYWAFPDGWTPALAEGAREIMYMGDNFADTGGLETRFRVYWQQESDAVLNSVDRTIAAYSFTNRFTAHCPVLGGADPCQRADQRITGATIAKNTPLPNNVGAAADHVHFFWNVREGNGFTLPYTEHAGFHAGTLAYSSRRFVFNSSCAFFYTSAGVNDRFHTGITNQYFCSTSNPFQIVGLDDDFNPNPPGWEVYIVNSSPGTWSANNSGDYTRTRGHNPQGNAWIATGVTSHPAASQYRPSYTVFQRERDNNGTLRFDQQ